MFNAFLNIWKISDLRNKVLFTLSMLVIYRIGFFIPLPGVDQVQLESWARRASEGNFGGVLQYMQIFTGGSFSQSTIFGLGIMPYISAAIIFQLFGAVFESLKKLQREGPAGRQKIQEWTRYATVGLCLVQAIFWMRFLQSGEDPLVYPEWVNSWQVWVSGVVGLTAGTVFLMWLGEQIDRYGIGNGISLIITAGIIAQMDDAITLIVTDFDISVASGAATFGWQHVVFLIVAFIGVTAGAIIITQGQRRIPIQQQKHTRGRRVYGGQRSYLPLRVNHGGVMPIIFASSLMIFPTVIFGYIAQWAEGMRMQEDTGAVVNGIAATLIWFTDQFTDMGGYFYTLVYIILIYFFSYFWTSVQFQPEEVARNLRDSGAFVPGLRPGPRTAEYLETVMERITYVGAGFLAVIAVIPTIVSAAMNIPFLVSQFLGGTGLLIVVSVMLDFVQRIEAQLLMRNYQGFLAQGESGRGPRIRGAHHAPAGGVR